MSPSRKWNEFDAATLVDAIDRAAGADGLFEEWPELASLLGREAGWDEAARLFDAVAGDKAASLPFEVVGAPGRVVGAGLRAGDLLVRRALGEGALAQVSVIAAPETIEAREIEARGLAAEGLRPGSYVQVIELFPQLRSRADGYHRLALDPNRRLPSDQIILRSRVGGVGSEAENAFGDAEINRRSREYVRWQQDALNQLIGAGLAVDGIHGPLTRAAVRTYQGRRPPLRVDGVVGPNTERRLVGDGAPYPPGYSAAMDDAQGAPPAFPPGAVALPNVQKPARYSLRRLSRGDAGARADAGRLVNALRAHRLGGVYSDASAEAAGIAATLGRAPAQLVPAGRNGALVRVTGGALPFSAYIIYRDIVERIWEEIDRLLRELSRLLEGDDRYGGFDLQRGDRDQQDGDPPIWGGQPQPIGGGAPFPPHVRNLQEDLRRLGFDLAGTPNGIFGRHTEWSVREFQIYAKMDHVARENTASTATRLVDRLSQVATGIHRYTGPVSGVLNRATRAALRHWLANNWRCPVVVEAWNMAAGARTTLHQENLWLHDSMTSSAPRVFVRDFSDYYALPAGRNANDLRVIGDYVTYPPTGHSGPRSVPPNHTWSEGEILPDSFVGVGLAALTAPQRSTFKAIRAVSEVECLGFYDSVNAYDNAFISLGPCHWTLGIVSGGTVSEGELCGYLSYLRHADAAAFQSAIEFFGARVDENWVNAGVADGSNLWVAGQRKYAGWMALQDESGNFNRLPLDENDGNYFKTWHWHYRFIMAGRTIVGYRRRMWDMARVRIRDIRDAPWGAGVAQVNAGTPTARNATIGDVFTSERAIAIILRWHIRFPGDIIAGGNAANRLRNALATARATAPGLTWTGAPNAWTDAHETALVQGLRQAVTARGNANLSNSINYVDNWPNWATGANPRGYALPGTIGNLSEDRNSFDFDTAGLPPAP